MSAKDSTHFQIAIIGSGFGGLGTAIQLKKEGIDDFAVFERAGDVGGTWRDNTYPGCACDVQSHLYSFSFAPNPNWSRMYSPQPEIWEYLRYCAANYGILPHIRFHHEVRGVAWDQSRQHWHIETSQGDYTATILVAGVGALCEPTVPQLRGIERFQGKTFHSARWDHNHNLAGRSVAVIGTGASAIQFVPEIQPKVDRLYLFQRTPPWIIPRHDRQLTDIERLLFKKFPFTQQLIRAAIYLKREFFVVCFRDPRMMWYFRRTALRHLEKAVSDPKLRAKLTPNYTIGCKRVLISNNYLPSLTRSNVEVVSEGIREVRANSIVTEDGMERQIDTIIYGTGFQVTDMPFAKIIRGRDGRTLSETWQGSPKAYLGTTVSGFPNYFQLLGPNTVLSHSSVVYMIESQIAHVLDAVRYMRKHNIATIEPRAEVQAKFIAEIDKLMQGTVWTSGGCASWYLDKTGRNSILWPGFTWLFRRRVEHFQPIEYHLTAQEDSARVSNFVENVLEPS
ncbi:MAG: NAD(P)/FAD-dependent oxidoreductase [Acidobacteriota bacterium]